MKNFECKKCGKRQWRDDEGEMHNGFYPDYDLPVEYDICDTCEAEETGN